jgi:rhomboid protease GluP
VRLTTAPFTLAMIAICVVVYAADWLMQGALTQAGALYPPLVQQGQWWRLITSGFLHANLPHVLFNMYALLQAGALVEFCYGTPRYATIYLLSLLGGSVAAYYSTLGQNIYTLGASGAIMGVFGAMAVLAFKLPQLRRALLQSAILPILLTLGYGAFNAGISNAAHIGGVLTGVLVAVVLNPVRGRELAPVDQDA